MYDVFISYSTQNSKQAEKIRDILESKGISCWYAPVNIHGHRDFTEEIPKAIRNAKAFLLLVSNAAQESKWVKREVRYADNYDIPIYALFIEECELDNKFDFVLGNNQHYAFSLGFEEQKKRLLNDLKEDFEELENNPQSERKGYSLHKTAEKKKIIFGIAVIAVILVAVVAIFVFKKGDGKQYIIWNPAYKVALTGEVVNQHYHAGEKIAVKSGKPSGYSDDCLWKVEYIDEKTFTISQDGENLGMEPGYNGIGFGGNYTSDKWRMEETEDGYYICNTKSGYYLEWYVEKNNWSTHNIITEDNKEKFVIQIDEVS